MTDRWVDEPVSCGDPECPELQPSAQPEADGDLRYHACACGFEFGYEMAGQDEDAGACSLGVPEAVRRRASVPPQEPVFLQIGRRPQ